ncbi:glycosyltransferase [Actinotalea sp. JY-7876]|uniref:glycosyltransferase n=1 Tax=Actinotalea sp. JY-7876 TaxID=2758442 RepID=UPI0015F6998E|nr:glycosyltransferase [Actinotalea sp. JY-7876]
MRVAVRWSDALIGGDGHVWGHDAGSTLLRRLLRVFPDAQVVAAGHGRLGHGVGFDVVPLELVDGDRTVLISMDVLDSPSVWRTMRATSRHPRLVNFVWWSPSEHVEAVDRASLALSCALFPTFANSQRTADEVRAAVREWTVPALADGARLAWADLGIRLAHLQPRHEPEVPVVLYPAIHLAPRKRPDLFVAVVERVARRTPVRVEARLEEQHLVGEAALRLARREWAWVGPLTPTREGYWRALAGTTAFLATAEEESYGLAYVEALVAGAVGVLPDLPWARAILPPGYPFLYRDAAQAEAMLLRAVTDTAGCRRALDAAAEGSFAQWLGRRHDDDRFEHAIAASVAQWSAPAPPARGGGRLS